MRVRLRGAFPGVEELEGVDVIRHGRADVALHADARTALPALARGVDEAVVGRVGAAPDRALELAGRQLLKRADSILVPTWAQIPRVREAFGVSRRKVDVVPLGVDVDFWIPAEQERGADLPVVVMLLDLPRAERRAAVRAVQDLGVRARVLVPGVGTAPDEPLRELYRAADVVLVAARGDAHLTAALQVMATGTPLVTTDRDGATEYVTPEETGLVVPTAMPLACAAAVGHLLADPSHAAGLAEAARRAVASRFTPTHSATALARVLHRVAG